MIQDAILDLNLINFWLERGVTWEQFQIFQTKTSLCIKDKMLFLYEDTPLSVPIAELYRFLPLAQALLVELKDTKPPACQTRLVNGQIEFYAFVNNVSCEHALPLVHCAITDE